MGGILAGFVVLLTPLFILHWLTMDRSGHRWKYRNPYTRTCMVCDRQEDNYCTSWAYARRGLRAPGWWEEMRPGNGPKCTEHKPEGNPNEH